jgi:PPOX class probable F420-dependent enzyme
LTSIFHKPHASAMPPELDEDTSGFIRTQRVARLATASEDRQPSVIPICYVFDGERIYTPIDEKPKSVDARKLKRIRNIEANPQVALVIDEYSEDWSKLIYVLVSGTAQIISPGLDTTEHARAVDLLREKYPQYRLMKIDERMIIRITPSRITRWTPVGKGTPL